MTVSRETLTPPLQYRCAMCGAPFLLVRTMQRHREAELPAFRATSQAKRAAYEASRRAWRASLA